MKPHDLFDRDVEWEDLDRFVNSATPGVQVGVLYGRRRMGKSFLLRRLVLRHGGIYHMALEEEASPARQRFADAVGVTRGLGPGQLRMQDWAEALRTALSGPERLLVIDELPYLLAQAPGAAIPSVLQSLFDASRDSGGAPARRVIVCGSALAVMAEILSGQKALRGRVQLALILRPFDYRTNAAFYGVENPQVAFHLYAIFGGIPGYRDLLAGASPQTNDELRDLLLETVCNPSHALFSEPAYLLREDPRVTSRALYHSILGAISAGATTPTGIAGVLGRDARSLAHALDVLITAGFVRKADDLLHQRRPTLRLADPIVRFHDLVVNPRLPAFEDRRALPAWEHAQPALRSRLYGPAFEELAREWTARHAGVETLGGPAGEVGTTVINDSSGKAQYEVDVVVLAAGQRRQARNPEILAIGEAKDSDRQRTMRDLARLDRIRSLLVARGAGASSVKLLLFSRSGFDVKLEIVATERDDIELIDLNRIRYGR